MTYYANNTERVRYSQLSRKYNLSIEQIVEMEQRCGGLCQICGNPSEKVALAIDHDHVSGRARGMLCMKCNVGIGHFQDNPTLLIRAAEYLGARTALAVLAAEFERSKVERAVAKAKWLAAMNASTADMTARERFELVGLQTRYAAELKERNSVTGKLGRELGTARKFPGQA